MGLKRKSIVFNRMPNADGSLSRNLMFDNSNICHEFHQGIQEDLDKFTESQLDLLLAKLREKKRTSCEVQQTNIWTICLQRKRCPTRKLFTS